MSNFDIKINVDEVTDTLKREILKALEESAGMLQKQVKMNTAVDSSKTKDSWDYVINSSKFEAVVGSTEENAIWEEFGTGVHALDGKGRKTPWFIPVEGYTGKRKPSYKGKVVVVYGKDGKKYFKTDGKKPKRPFYNAKNTVKPRIEMLFNERLGKL